MAIRWQVEDEEAIGEFRIGGLRRVRARSPRTGRSHEFYELRFPEWINVLAIDREDRVILIRQFRIGSREVMLEIPGGLVEPGETPEQSAVRELREETGYEASCWRLLCSVHPNPAFQGNRCHTFLADAALRVAEQSLEPAEEIDVVPVPLGDVPDLIRRGEITHTLVISAFARLWLERGLPPSYPFTGGDRPAADG